MPRLTRAVWKDPAGNKKASLARSPASCPCMSPGLPPWMLGGEAGCPQSHCVPQARAASARRLIGVVFLAGLEPGNCSGQGARPGLGTLTACLSRATFWTARGPIPHPRPVPLSNRSASPHTEFLPVSSSTVCRTPSPRGPARTTSWACLRKNPEMLGARAVAVASPWPRLDPRQEGLSPSQLTLWHWEEQAQDENCLRWGVGRMLTL